MKKFIVLILIMFFFQPCKAQQNNLMQKIILNANVFVGIGVVGIGGPNSGLSWIDPVGTQIGIESTILEINENSSINSGINLSYQGAGYKEEEFSGRVRLTYINVPFLFTYQNKDGLYGEVGLQPGLLISARDRVDGGGSSNYKDYVKVFELGLPNGAGYQINEQLSVGVRAVWGLTNNNDYWDGNKDHNYLVVVIVRYNIGSFLMK